MFVDSQPIIAPPCWLLCHVGTKESYRTLFRYVEKYTRNPGALRIDYIIRANCIPIWFFAVAALAAITAGIISKKWSVGLLIGYVLIILGETVIFRTPTGRIHFQPQLFWSYEVWDIQKEQILANILAYIPLGLIAGKLWRWKGIIAGIGLTVITELLQLITHRGLFEFDDIVHNTLGTLIGILLVIICEKYVVKILVRLKGIICTKDL